jgi:hypothetical protein
MTTVSIRTVTAIISNTGPIHDSLEYRKPFQHYVLLRRLRCVRASAPDLGAAVQRPRDRFGDIAAHERFAQHLDDPGGLGAFAQLRTAVAAHEND